MAEAGPKGSAPGRRGTGPPGAREGAGDGAGWLRLLAGPSVAAAVVALAAGALHLQGPPSPRPSDAPEDRFSAGRAMEHVRALAREPRPPGTPSHERARAYLLERLRGLGLEPEVQEQRLMFPRGRMVGSVHVRNVVARVPGRDPTGTVALVTHYDSRWRTPGAGDAAAPVAALLETLRALRPRLPLRNDLVLLFTDAEEMGLLGARAFRDGHRWMDDISFVANFEARGSAGPSLMFETGGSPGRVVRRLAEAGSRPVTSSLFDVVYRRLPNDTDFTVFRSAGKAGMNFAFIRGAEAYHTPLDTPERLSRASLQHHGEHALSLARSLGDADLAEAGGGSPVFFSVPAVGILRYPGWAATLLALALGIGTLLALGYGRVAGRVTGTGLVAGLVAAPVAVALGAGMAWLLKDAALAAHPEDGWLVAKQLYREAGYLAAAVCATGGLVFGLLSLLRRWFGAPSLVLGAVIWPVFLAVGVSLNIPAASYLLAWPAAAALAMAAWHLRPGGASPTQEAAVLLLLSLPVLAVGAPPVREFLAALSLGALAPLAAGAGVLVLCLVPLMELLARPNRWWFPSAAGAAGLVLSLPALLPTGGADGPENAPLVYGMEANGDSAWWATARDGGNSWVDGFVPDTARATRSLPAALYSAPGTREYRTAPAPALQIPGPTLDRVSGSDAGEGRRTLRVRLRVPGSEELPAPLLAAEVAADGEGGSRLLRVDGREVPGDPGGGWLYREFGAPGASTELTLSAPAGEPVRLRATLYLQGLTVVPGAPPVERPEGMMGSPVVGARRALTDLTLVRTPVRF